MAVTRVRVPVVCCVGFFLSANCEGASDCGSLLLDGLKVVSGPGQRVRNAEGIDAADGQGHQEKGEEGELEVAVHRRG